MSRREPDTGSAPSAASAGPVPAGSPPELSPREYVRVLVIAALLGIPVAIATAGFMSLSDWLIRLVWTTIPDGAGWTSSPWWYVLAVPVIAGLLVAVAVRLPGHGGEPAVAGIALTPLTLVQLFSALLAGARRGARELAERAAKLPLVVVLCAAGLVVGLLAVGFRAVTGQPVEVVLFSGEAALPQVIAETSAGVLALLVLFKGAAFALSLGAGFRGGPTFPAVVLGVAIGVLGSIVLPGLDLTPAVIAGLAAAASAALGLSFFGALLAVLLAGSAAADTVPIAVIASVIGWLVATALQKRETRHQSSSVPAG
jgi:H+/Cl- antiporter ClcA